MVSGKSPSLGAWDEFFSPQSIPDFNTPPSSVKGCLDIVSAYNLDIADCGDRNFVNWKIDSHPVVDPLVNFHTHNLVMRNSSLLVTTSETFTRYRSRS